MLGSQGPLPHLLPMSVPTWEQASDGPPTRVLYGQLPDEPPGGLIVNTKIIGRDEKTAFLEVKDLRSPKGTHYRLCLFKLNMVADESLAATIRFKSLAASMDVASGFYMGYNIPNSEKLCYIHVETSSPRPNQIQDKTIMLSFPTADSCLVEFGVYGLGLVEDPKPLALCQILNLTIRPRNQAESSWTIHGVRVTERGSSPYHDKRLAWKWSGSDGSEAACLPWSKTTGPFSYFDVLIGGKELGRAYCMEISIHGGDFDGCKGESVDVVIRGRLFGGSEITSLPMQLLWDEPGVP